MIKTALPSAFLCLVVAASGGARAQPAIDSPPAGFCLESPRVGLLQVEVDPAPCDSSPERCDGEYLDPAIDKLLAATGFIVMTLPLDYPNRVPLYLTTLVFARDFLIALVAIVLFLGGYRKG